MQSSGDAALQGEAERRRDPILTGRRLRDRLFFVVYAGLLLFGFFWAQFPHVRSRVTDLGPLQTALAAGLCYVALRAFVVLSGRDSPGWHAVWVAIDLALITVLVHLSGGINSEAALMYIVPIFTYSIQRRVWGVLILGACTGLLYTLTTLPPDPSLDYLGRLTTRLVVFVLVTVIAACYAVHETERVNELAALRAGLALADYRRELSAEIHDGIQHYLVGISMRLEMARSIAESDPKRAAAIAIDQRRAIRQAADELRYLIRRLRAPALEHLGFVEALEEHITMLQERSPVRMTLEVEGAPVVLSADAEHAAFRIVQECLNNVDKHAQATEATVTLTFGDGRLECTVADNGSGFDVAGLPEEPDLEGGFGLLTMRQRAEQAGGELQIDSAPGRGTRVRFTVRTQDAVPSAGHTPHDAAARRDTDAGSHQTAPAATGTR